MSIREFLGLGHAAPPSAAATAETATVRKIVESLDRLPPDQARYLAAFAYILSRVASVDLEVSAAERDEMERLVMEHGELGEEQALLVVQMAKTQSLLFGATENFLVTREFNRIATRPQKLALLRCLFSVSAADESISTLEDREVRRIADELQIEHREFIAARLAYRQHLSVLRRPPGGPPGRE
jgi:uncharacterized tellurite resistance protein B-like protein